MKYFVVIVVLFFGIVGFFNVQFEVLVFKLMVKFGVLSLIDFVLFFFNLVGEFQISGCWYGQMEVGLIFNFEDQVDGLRIGDKSGFWLWLVVCFYYQEKCNWYFLEFLLVYCQVLMDIDGEFFIVLLNEFFYN